MTRYTRMKPRGMMSARSSHCSDTDGHCRFERPSNRNTARARRRESLWRERDRTLRASMPKVSAVVTSPTSALPSVGAASVLPLGKTVSRNGFSSCFDSAGSGSGFL
jgi:hypothetical protein